MTSHVDCWGLSVPPNAKGQGIHWSGEKRGGGGGGRGRSVMGTVTREGKGLSSSPYHEELLRKVG